MQYNNDDQESTYSVTPNGIFALEKAVFKVHNVLLLSLSLFNLERQIPS